LVCRRKEPLIRAAFGALIGADPRNEGSANQRFLPSGKVVHDLKRAIRQGGFASFAVLSELCAKGIGWQKQ